MGLLLETAVTLSFLTAGFYNQQSGDPEKTDILSDLGIGQDHFTYECYPIAEAIEILNMDVERDRGCPGVYHYEAIEEIAAKVLFDYVDKHGSVPIVLEFIGQFKPQLEKWYEGN